MINNLKPQHIKKIGLFDSGIGGHTLLREMVKDFPGIEFYYIADNDWAPYGEKSPQQVQDRSLKIVELLVEKGAELIVVACNTATSLAIEKLRSEFTLEFVGVEPYVNAINKLNFNIEQDKIAVLTTSAMFSSERFKNLLEKYDPSKILTPLKVPQLASIIEKLYQEGVNSGLKDELRKELNLLIQGDFTHAILGCTHYPLIANFLQKELGIYPISPCPHVSQRVGSLINASCEISDRDYYWYLETRQNIWKKISKEDLPKPLIF